MKITLFNCCPILYLALGCVYIISLAHLYIFTIKSQIFCPKLYLALSQVNIISLAHFHTFKIKPQIFKYLENYFAQLLSENCIQPQAKFTYLIKQAFVIDINKSFKKSHIILDADCLMWFILSLSYLEYIP